MRFLILHFPRHACQVNDLDLDILNLHVLLDYLKFSPQISMEIKMFEIYIEMGKQFIFMTDIKLYGKIINMKFHCFRKKS